MTTDRMARLQRMKAHGLWARLSRARNDVERQANQRKRAKDERRQAGQDQPSAVSLPAHPGTHVKADQAGEAD